MAMPEAAINKNDSPVFWKDQIGFSRKSLYMQPVPKTKAVKTFPDQKFGLRIFSSNSRHHPGTGFLVNYINHLGTSSWLVSGFQIYCVAIVYMRG